MSKFLALLILSAGASLLHAEDKAPTVDQILDSVEKQIAPDTKALAAKPVGKEPLIREAEARLSFEIMNSKDRKLRVLHAITCLNSSIRFLEESRAVEVGKNEDYQRMVKFREMLAKEYLAVAK